jgi:excisionase family DNA binding protein
MSKVIVTSEAEIMSMVKECFSQELEAFANRFFPNGLKQTELVEPDQKFTVKQLSEYWQCHPQTIMQKKRKGELPFFQHGRKLLFSKRAIDQLTANSVQNPGK